MALKIGDKTLKYGLIMAPLAGVTDRAFRLIAKECGADLLVTEMVSAKALHFNDDSSERLAYINEDETPCSVQIFGHEPIIMAEAAEKIQSKINIGNRTPFTIDINMGCPMKKIVSNGDGAALLKDPSLAEEIIRAVVSVSKVPVTVKIRTGWDRNTKNSVRMAEIAEKAGAAMLTVHGRTREDMYTPPVDLQSIAEVKRAVTIPVIANGGIFSSEDALRTLEITHCDGLMIARGAMGNPWIFKQIKAAIDGKKYVLPGLTERMALALHQIELMIEDKGERTAVLEARRQLAYYIKGEKGAADARYRISSASTFDELKAVASDFITAVNGSIL